jgi:hypothetical protein
MIAEETITNKFQDYILDSIKKSVESEEVELIFEQTKNEMIKKMEQSKREILAQAMMRISDYVSIKDLGRTVRIEILNSFKFDENK